MTYKHYLIYFHLALDCNDKAKRPEVDAARVKALEATKKQFKKEMKELIDAKEVRWEKEQPEDAAHISIKEEALEAVLKTLVEMDIVLTIDANYSGLPPIKEEKPKENDMKRFLK